MSRPQEVTQTKVVSDRCMHKYRLDMSTRVSSPRRALSNVGDSTITVSWATERRLRISRTCEHRQATQIHSAERLPLRRGSGTRVPSPRPATSNAGDATTRVSWAMGQTSTPILPSMFAHRRVMRLHSVGLSPSRRETTIRVPSPRPATLDAGDVTTTDNSEMEPRTITRHRRRSTCPHPRAIPVHSATSRKSLREVTAPAR